MKTQRICTRAPPQRVRRASGGRWMPENHELWRVFLGEFCWAPAFRFHDQPYYSHEGWSRGSGKVIPRPVLSSADAYLGETSTRDCSVVDTARISIPSKFIVEGLKLKWNGIEGHVFDRQGRLTAKSFLSSSKIRPTEGHFDGTKSVPESNSFTNLRLALSEKQIPRFVGIVDS